MRILTIILLFLSNYAYAQGTYYFSESTGDDNRTPTQAKSSATPWKTLAKASSYSASMLAGDHLSFKRGDVFYGSLVMGRSGGTATPMVIEAYGTGPMPVLTGFVTLSGWTLVSGNVYQASVVAKPTLNMVTVNALPVAMGRTPNAGAGIANLGYYPYTSWSTNTKITAGGLFGTNWVGATLVIRKNRYVMEREIITAQVDSTVTYRPTAAINPRQNGNPIGVSSTPVENSGLFIMNDPRTLDVHTEWFHDTVAHTLKMYFTGTPSSYVVKVATVDTILNLNNKNNIIVDGVRIEGGNMSNVYFQDGNTITIKNCELFYCGAKSIFGWNTLNTLIQNNTINYSMSTGIDLVNRHARFVYVRGNRVKNTGIFQGMGCNFDDNDYKAIYASVDSFGAISHNYIDTVGYVGIGYNGNKVNVDSNYLNYFGNLKDDGGGIYSFTGAIPLNYGRTVRNNIVLNGIGARSPQSNYTHIEGIYTDGAASGIDIQRNSIGYVKGRSIHMNDPKSFNVNDNVAFGTYGWAINKHFNDSINNFKMTRNQFFDTAAHNSDSKTSYFNEGFNSTKPPISSTIGGSINAIGLIDSNYYNLPGGNATYFSYYYRVVNPGPITFMKPGVDFAGWKLLGSKDLHSIELGGIARSNLRFEYNPSDTILQVLFPGSIYREANGTTYTNAVNIPRWGSKALIYMGATSSRPIVSAGSNQAIVLPITSIPVTGTATDPDGTITARLWSQLSGPATVSFSAATSNSTVINGLTIAGNYLIQFKATGSGGSADTASATMIVAVSPPVNIPPVISPSPVTPQTITAPTSSTSATVFYSDADGTITSKRWYYLSGPAGSTITNGTTATATFSGLTVGIYSYGVTIIDNSGDSVLSTFKLTVNPAANIPPVISPNPVTGQSITLPTNTTSATVFYSDADGTVVAWRWYYLSGPAGVIITNGTTATATFSSLTAGTYSFRVRVTDNSGDSTSSTFSLIVNPANVKPVISPSPVAGQTITLPVSSTSATASATDPDGTIVSRRWYRLSGPAGAVITNGTTATATFSSLTAGTYSFGFTAIDNSGDSTLTTFALLVNPVPNTPPVIAPNPIPGQSITLPVNSTSATVFATDADGTIASYRWYKISGPAPSLITSGTTATATFSGLAQGTYSFGVTVKDNSGDSVLSTFALIVNPAIPPPNTPPVISPNPIPSQTKTLPTNSTTATVFATDADGTIASRLWTYVSGPATYTITNATSATATFSNLVAGTYNFKVRVLDNSGDSATAGFQLIINLAPNVPPVISPNPVTGQVLTLPTNSTTATVFASDADGSIVSYLWTKLSGPATYTLTNATTATASFSNLVAGSYNFKVRVIDNRGDSATANFSLTVNAANVAPVISPNPVTGQTIQLPVNATNATVFATDIDGTIASYLWTKLSGPSTYTLTNSTTATASFSNLVVGTYNFKVRVLDNSGDSATANFQLVVTPAANVPPFINPIPDKSITLPTNSISVTAVATDADGTVASYSWSGSGPSVPSFSAPSAATTTIGSLIAGAYNIKIRVTDNSGDSAIRTFQILVNPKVNKKPAIHPKPIPTQTKTLPTSSTTATVSALDTDGIITTYRWDYLSGPTVTMSNTTDSTVTLSNLNVGVYNFSTTVIDNDGDSTLTTFQLVVNDAPVTPPIPNAGADITITQPDSAVALSGSATAGSCAISAHTWTLVSSPAGSSPIITTPSNYISTVTNLLVAGDYRFRLTVTSSCASDVFDEVVIRVQALNPVEFCNCYPTFVPFQPNR